MADGITLGPLRTVVSREDVAVASVKALFENEMNAEKVVVIVEGQDDVMVYGSFMREDRACIYPDGNCQKHFRILSSLNPYYGDRLLAIKDADFDRVESKSYCYDNLFLTDTHDLEGMILAGGLPELEGEDAVCCSMIEMEEIYAELEGVSYLKWYNHTKCLGINFSDTQLDTNVESYLCDAIAKTNNVINVRYDDYLAFVNDNPGVSLKEICNGHDIFECIYRRARAVSKINFEKKAFWRRLRCAYKIEDFCETNLYRSIMLWQNRVDHPILIS